ncbi:MAG: 50S ribosomal protein L29 [Clostridia bacterium]|nr:50S ribosomal protein L29 [Clostridia bacterium]
MKRSEIEKLRDLSPAEREKKLQDLKDELFRLRFQHAIKQLDNPMRLKAVKKEIAIIKTIDCEAQAQA